MCRSQIVSLLCQARRHFLQLRLRYGKHSSARILAGRCGFFGNMFITLNGIRLCEAAGVHPQPFWNQESLFFEKSHGDNVWDYYFEPIAIPGHTCFLDVSGKLAFKPDAASIGPRDNGRTVLETYHQCIQKYVRLKEEVRTEIERLRADLFGSQRVVGVHARFTDTQAGFENRIAQPISKYFQKIDDYSVANPVDRIFVATDSLPVLQSFQRRYGEKIIALDCIRSVDDTSIHGHYDSGLPGSPYLKGLEVIRDAYLLASVSHLVRVNSRVTAYSLCLNPALTFTDVESEAGGCQTTWLAKIKG